MCWNAHRLDTVTLLHICFPCMQPSSISSAMQKLSADPAETAKPYKISDLIPKSWDGSHWMQARSHQSERILVGVESVDKVERSTLAPDCTEAHFRTFETALYQVLRRKTTNHCGWLNKYKVKKRCDQRSTSDRSSATTSANVIVQKTKQDQINRGGAPLGGVCTRADQQRVFGISILKLTH